MESITNETSLPTEENRDKPSSQKNDNVEMTPSNTVNNRYSVFNLNAKVTLTENTPLIAPTSTENSTPEKPCCSCTIS